MPIISSDDLRLHKALGLLGDVKTTSKTFLSDPVVTRGLADQEKEQSLSYDQMAKHPVYSQVLKHLHDEEYHPSPDERDGKGRQVRINTNRFRKLSSGIVINSTAAVMLAGARVDETKHGFDRNLEIAALIYDLQGEKTRGGRDHIVPALLEKDKTLIDDDYIRTEFGTNVLAHVKGINTALAQLEAGQVEEIPQEYASVAAAISAARVREAMKIVGTDLVDRLPGEAKEAFIRENRLAGNENAAKTLLDREYGKLQKILTHSAIHEAVRTPIETTLVPAMEEYQRSGNTRIFYGKPVPAPEGESKPVENIRAYADFNRVMPIMNYRTDEKKRDYTDLDVYKMMLLQTRYHQDCTRKDGSSIFSHVLDTIGVGTRSLGESLRNTVVLVLGLHDWLEDGGAQVAGFDAGIPDLDKIYGNKMFKLIGEMTDEYSKDVYKERARLTKEESTSAHLFVEDLLREEGAGSVAEALHTQQMAEGFVPPSHEDQLKAHLKKGFSLTTGGPKLADVVSTARKILEEPQTNEGQWKYSGARIGWLENNKGYGNMLYHDIAKDVLAFFMRSDYKEKILSSGHKEEDLNIALLKFLSVTKQTLDAYTLQNLVVLADEFGLDAKGREGLRDAFLNMNLRQSEFKEYLDQVLVKLEDHVPANLTTVNAQESTREHQVRRYDNLLSLRESFSEREMFRKALLACDNLRNEPASDTILASMKQPDWKKLDREVVKQYDEKLGITKERFSKQLLEQGQFTKRYLTTTSQEGVVSINRNGAF